MAALSPSVLGTPLFVTAQFAEEPCAPSRCDTVEGLRRKPNFFFFFCLSRQDGWVRAQTSLPHPNSENILQTGNRASDNMLDRLWRPACGTELCFPAKNRNEVCSKGRAGEEGKYVDPLFPSCVFWTCVCEFWWWERMLEGTVPISIEADGFGAQRRTLLAEIAHPLLRNNIKKPLRRPLQTIKRP